MEVVLDSAALWGHTTSVTGDYDRRGPSYYGWLLLHVPGLFGRSLDLTHLTGKIDQPAVTKNEKINEL